MPLSGIRKGNQFSLTKLEADGMGHKSGKTDSFFVATDDEQDDNMDDDMIDDITDVFESYEDRTLMGLADKKANGGKWRLIEEAKERLRLKRELADFYDYRD
jgi:hypothetical protein